MPSRILFDLNVLIACFHGVGGTQFLLDIITLNKLSPACALHMSLEIILKPKVSSAPTYGSFIICSAVAEASGTAFDFFNTCFCISHSWRKKCPLFVAIKLAGVKLILFSGRCLP